jgi:histidine phosphotransferase ChpT
MEEELTPTGGPAHPAPHLVRAIDPILASVHFAETVVTRLCHDLSGAVSTLANALDMAVEEADAAGEALSIAAEGGQAVNARLRLLRAAWGGGLGPTPLPDIVDLIDGLPTRRRLQIDTDLVTETSTLPAGVARILLNVLLIAAESLPHGGKITVSGSVGEGLVVIISGRGAAWPNGLPNWLTSRSAAVAAMDDPRLLAGPLTALLAEAEGVRVSILMGGPPDMVPPLLIAGG